MLYPLEWETMYNRIRDFYPFNGIEIDYHGVIEQRMSDSAIELIYRDIASCCRVVLWFFPLVDLVKRATQGLKFMPAPFPTGYAHVTGAINTVAELQLEPHELSSVADFLVLWPARPPDGSFAPLRTRLQAEFKKADRTLYDLASSAGLWKSRMMIFMATLYDAMLALCRAADKASRHGGAFELTTDSSLIMKKIRGLTFEDGVSGAVSINEVGDNSYPWSAYQIQRSDSADFNEDGISNGEDVTMAKQQKSYDSENYFYRMVPVVHIDFKINTLITNYETCLRNKFCSIDCKIKQDVYGNFTGTLAHSGCNFSKFTEPLGSLLFDGTRTFTLPADTPERLDPCIRLKQLGQGVLYADRQQIEMNQAGFAFQISTTLILAIATLASSVVSWKIKRRTTFQKWEIIKVNLANISVLITMIFEGLQLSVIAMDQFDFPLLNTILAQKFYLNQAVYLICFALAVFMVWYVSLYLLILVFEVDLHSIRFGGNLLSLGSVLLPITATWFFLPIVEIFVKSITCRSVPQLRAVPRWRCYASRARRTGA